MQHFYHNLDAGMGKDEALQQARLTYLDESSKNHPYFWAAFVLIGDDQPISADVPWWKTWWVWLLIAAFLLGVRLTIKRKS